MKLVTEAEGLRQLSQPHVGLYDQLMSYHLKLAGHLVFRKRHADACLHGGLDRLSAHIKELLQIGQTIACMRIFVDQTNNLGGNAILFRRLDCCAFQQ